MKTYKVRMWQYDLANPAMIVGPIATFSTDDALDAEQFRQELLTQPSTAQVVLDQLSDDGEYFTIAIDQRS